MGGFFRRGLFAVTAAALAALLAGCAGDAGSSLADVHRDPALETTGGHGLPPGVAPPSGDPQPGDARLGPDGYYDYTADDFVLGDPCDSEWAEQLKAGGWMEHESSAGRHNLSYQRGCVFYQEDSITFHPVALMSLNMDSRNVEAGLFERNLHSSEAGSWYTTPVRTIGMQMCFAAVDTERGTFGLAVEHHEYGPYKTYEEACTYASDHLQTLLRGDAL